MVNTVVTMQKKLSICCFVIVEACLCGSKVSYFSSALPSYYTQLSHLRKLSSIYFNSFFWLYNLALLNV